MSRGATSLVLNKPQSMRQRHLSWLLLGLLAAGCGTDQSASTPRPEDRGSVPYLKLSGRQVALCVGVDRYMFSEKVPATRCGNANARALATLLKDRYGFETEELTEGQATKSAVLDRLEKLGTELTDKDILIVYFGGHGQILELPDGTRYGYLLPHDADLSLDESTDPARLRTLTESAVEELVGQWDNRAINVKQFMNRLGPLNAQHVVVIVDSCFSGFMTQLGGPPLTDQTDLEELLRRRSRSVLAATTDNNLALVPADSTHSLFTGSLLKRLATDDPASLTEVFLDVRKEVAAATKSQPEKFRMLPQRGDFGGDGGEFVFVPASLAAAQMQPRVRQSLARTKGQLPGLPAIADVLRASAQTDYHFGSRPIEADRVWKDRASRYEVSASLGDSLSMAALHYCYSRGLGVTRNDTAAYQWAKKAFDTGRPEGKYVMGRCLLNGIGVEKNAIAGERLIRASADYDFPLAIYTIATLKLPADRPTNEQELGAIRPLLEKAAKAGVAPAKSQLALLIAGQPRATKAEIDTAVRLFQEAAESGDASANYPLFQHHANGSPDHPRNIELARKVLLRGAEDGNSLCQLALACEHFPRVGFPDYWSRPLLNLPINLNEATKWAELAASNNFAPALLYLAELYQGSKEAPAQPDKAKDYCERAAKNGYAQALVTQGVWYRDGVIYEPSDKKAFDHFAQAARMGDFKACGHLAEMYREARGMDLKGYSQGEMKPVLAFRRLHWLVRGTELARKQGLSGTHVEETLREIAPRVPDDVLNDLKALYPDSHKLFVEEFRSKR